VRHLPRRLLWSEVPSAGNDLQPRRGNRLLELFPNPQRNHAIVLTPDDRRRCRDAAELVAELSRLVTGESADVRDEGVATVGAGERSQIEIERVRGAIGIAIAALE